MYVNMYNIHTYIHNCVSIISLHWPIGDHPDQLTSHPWHHLVACFSPRPDWVLVSLNHSTNLNDIAVVHRGQYLQLLLMQTSLLYSKLPPTMVDVRYHTIATLANGLSHGFLWRQWDIGTFLKDVRHILHKRSRDEYTYKIRQRIL